MEPSSVVERLGLNVLLLGPVCDLYIQARPSDTPRINRMSYSRNNYGNGIGQSKGGIFALDWLARASVAAFESGVLFHTLPSDSSLLTKSEEYSKIRILRGNFPACNVSSSAFYCFST